MDISVQTKGFSLMTKLAKRDLKDVPIYGYQVQKPPARMTPPSSPLPRSTPEAEGLSSERVAAFYQKLGADNALGVHAAIVLRHGSVIAEGYWAPFRGDVPHMLYSMSKSITGTAVGIAADEGLLSLDEKLSDIFSDITPSAQARFWKNATIKNLLTMSVGGRFNELGSMVDADWSRMFMESLPRFEAGSEFYYNSLNTYMLSAIVSRRAGMSLSEYLTPRLYEPLGIDEHPWETCPMGIEKGGWGLALKLEDSAKIGQLYLSGGLWNGKRILSEEWVREATSKQIETPNGEAVYGYGYQIWMNQIAGAYQFNGAFGQYVVVLPRLDAVVAIYSGSAQLFAKGTIEAAIEALFYDASDTPLPENPAAAKALDELTHSLIFAPKLPVGTWQTGVAAFEHIARSLDGSEYHMDPNAGSIFPATLQNVHGNFSPGVDTLKFRVRDEMLLIDIGEDATQNTIAVRKDGGFTLTRVSLQEETQLVAARGAWQVDETHMWLVVVAPLIETHAARILTFYFENDRVRVVFDETPAVDDASRMLIELLGYNFLDTLKKLVAEMKSEKITKKLRDFSTPTGTGVRIKHNEEIIIKKNSYTFYS